MTNLEKKLRLLAEKRSALNKFMMDEHIGSKTSYGTMRLTDSIKYVEANLTKEHLEAFDDGTQNECGRANLRLPLVACLARRFLTSHPANKRCKRCVLLNKYVESLVLEIDKHEE